MVSPVKQIWKDFSSGKGGNSVTFLMEHEHFTYPEAIKYLANKYGIEVEETIVTNEDIEQANEKESMYLVSEFARDYFHRTMLNTDEGQAIGLSYFKERGFSKDTIEKFQLGYSPDSWDAFTKEALGKAYKLEYLEKTGLTIVKQEDGKTFDRFKGRVMFPIQSMSGRVLGFGGRILTNDKKAAKYLNSPESDIYHKSKVLYGIFQAKQSIAKLDNCYLVEGYTDVIQFNQSGIENVVASSGTALTPDQIRLVHRLTNNITVLFDGDAAGLRASIRGIDLILEAGMNVKVCSFPDGEDPDSFAKNNSYDVLKQYLDENSKDFIQFKADLLVKEANNDPIKKAELIRDMVNSISKISDFIKREIYIKECSRIMDITEEVIRNTLAQIEKKDVSDANKKFTEEKKAFEVHKNNENLQPAKIDSQYIFEQKIIEILLTNGLKSESFTEVFQTEDETGNLVDTTEKNEYKVYEKLYLDLQEDEIELSNPIFKTIYTDIINYYNQNLEFEIDKYISETTPEITDKITSILMLEERDTLNKWHLRKIVVEDKNVNLSDYVSDTIYAYRFLLICKLLYENSQKVSPNIEVDNSEFFHIDIDYNKLKKVIAKKLDRVLVRFDFK